MQEETDFVQSDKEITNWFKLWDDSVWDVDWSQQWNIFITTYGLPFTRYIISFIYYVYIRSTLINVGIWFLKYVPTFVFMYKLTKNFYVSSRKRIKQKQMEIEDIKEQMKIVNTKVSEGEAEIAERAQELRRATARLRYVRARVRDVIAADASLRHMMASQTPFDVHDSTTSNSEDEYMGELLTEFKCSHIAKSSDPLDFPESPSDFRESPSDFRESPSDFPESPSDHPAAPADGVYSCLTDDNQKICRIKIVRVTNIRVAYLRNYIKQKRQRRANRHALLKKKIESIKKLLENWQETLNTVINSNLSMMRVDPRQRHYQLVSQEAMGDYSKPNVGSDDSGDIDYDYDECSPNWARVPYNSDDYSETAHCGDYEYTDQPVFADMKYGGSMRLQCESNDLGSSALFALPETSSEAAIEGVAGGAARLPPPDTVLDEADGF